MNAEWRRFAPWAIGLALAAALIAAGLYIVQREFNLYVKISLGLVFVFLALSVLLNPEQARASLTGRQARYGSNMLVLTLGFLGILVLVNYFVYKNPKQWDLTEGKENTLAPETLDILKALPGNVSAKAFFTPELNKDSAQQLLDQYAYNSDGKFTFEFIDPVENPTAAQEAGITRNGAVVLSLGDASQPVNTVSEEGIDEALVRLMNPGGQTVYFLTGHGEHPLEGASDDTYSRAMSLLQAKNYTVLPLNLLAAGKIPDDADVVVINGPKQPVTEEEVRLLDDYLKFGGSLIVMEDPLILTEFGTSTDPLADYLANQWGILFGNNLVVDLEAAQAINQPFMAIANQFGDHAITQKMGGFATFFPTARSVTTSTPGIATITLTPLILTAERSWAETDMASIQDNSLQPDASTDVIGPVSVAVAGEDSATGGRVVVFGDSEFAMNAYVSVYGNGDMLTNSVDWAVGEEQLISLTPKNLTTRTLITPQPYTLGLILLVSLVVLPGLVLVGGIVTWVMRRRRG